MELQESRVWELVQDDIEVPCIVQWRLLWYSAQSHLNEVLIKIDALRICYDKMVIKPMVTALATPFWK